MGSGWDSREAARRMTFPDTKGVHVVTMTRSFRGRGLLLLNNTAIPNHDGTRATEAPQRVRATLGTPQSQPVERPPDLRGLRRPRAGGCSVVGKPRPNTAEAPSPRRSAGADHGHVERGGRGAAPPTRRADVSATVSTHRQAPGWLPRTRASASPKVAAATTMTPA